MVALFYLERNNMEQSRDEMLASYRTSSGKSIDQLQNRVSYLERTLSERDETIKLYAGWPEKKKRVFDTLKGIIVASTVVGVILATVGAIYYQASEAEKRTVEVLAVEHERDMDIAEMDLERHKWEAKELKEAKAKKKLRDAANTKASAEIKAFNQINHNKIFDSLAIWKKTNKIEGVSSCTGTRPKGKLDTHSFYQCDVLRDFKPDVKLLCTINVCGGAKDKK